MTSKRQRSKRARQRGWSTYILSSLLGAFLFCLGYSFFSYLSGERMLRRETSSRKDLPANKSVQSRLHPDVEISRKDVPPRSLSKGGGRPKIAIVIDDLGGENHLARKILLLDSPLTFSILPFTPYSRPLASEAPKRGKEVILHLPMEPYGYPEVRPGEGALLEVMSDERLLWQLSRDIESVPNLKGVSNHMGSRLMEDPEKLKVIFAELKRRGLFFLDSRTTPQTVGLQTAKFIGLKAMERTLFIDNSSNEEEIKKELGRLIQVSLSTGMAIGIGHPHPATIKSIREMIPKMKEEGIEIVRLSDLINE